MFKSIILSSDWRAPQIGSMIKLYWLALSQFQVCLFAEIDIIWASDECVYWLDSLYAWKLLDDSWKISYIPLIIP